VTWVKVCGLTRESDVAAAVDAGADALGFVLAENSPRRIGVARAATLMAGVPTLRILVTVDADRPSVELAVGETSADGLQPYGRYAGEVARWAEASGLFVLRPLRQTENGGWDAAEIPQRQVPLLDSAAGEAHGGTGVPLDWAKLQQPGRPFVLAGGLDPGNVGAAIDAARPWGVDASSGLESAPGLKDPARVAAFVKEAKRQ
jgi:phosphoribosylanthranilate isomerase